MGYIGNQTSNSYSSIAKQDLTGVTGSPVKRGFTLDNAVANANEIEVFVNNVRQEPGVAYTVSGTALTMTGDVETADDFYVVFQGKALQTTVPPDDSVTTARINDGAVTTDKIAANAVSTAKLFSGFANGITEYDQWRLTTDTSFSNNNVIGTASVSRVNTDGFEKIGTGVSLDTSTGYWSFPSTGFYIIRWHFIAMRTDNSASYMGVQLRHSTDAGSSWSGAGSSRTSGATDDNAFGCGEFMCKITDTTNHLIQFRFQTTSGSGTKLVGASSSNFTYFTFQKIKDA